MGDYSMDIQSMNKMEVVSPGWGSSHLTIN